MSEVEGEISPEERRLRDAARDGATNVLKVNLGRRKPPASGADALGKSDSPEGVLTLETLAERPTTESVPTPGEDSTRTDVLASETGALEGEPPKNTITSGKQYQRTDDGAIIYIDSIGPASGVAQIHTNRGTYAPTPVADLQKLLESGAWAPYTPPTED